MEKQDTDNNSHQQNQTDRMRARPHGSYDRHQQDPNLSSMLVEHSPAFYQAVWEHTTDAMALSDPEGIVLAANPAYYRLYGYTPDEVIGANFAILFPEDQRAQAIAHYQMVFRDELTVPAYEATIRRKDETERMVEAQAEFLTINGTRAAMLSVIRDITERRQSREALQEQQEFVQTLLEQFPDGSINVFDTDLRYLMAEGQGLAQVGLSSHQLVGKRLADVFPQEVVASVTPFFQKAFQGEVVVFELPFGGHVYEIHAAPLKYARMAISAILAIAQDVTARKQAETERLQLLTREQEARQAAEAAAQRSSRLQEVTAGLSQARTPSEVAEVIIRLGLVALEGQAGAVALLTEDEHDLTVLHAQGFPETVLKQWQRFPVNAPAMLSEAVRTNQALFLESPSQLLQRYPVLANVHAQIGSRAWASVPLTIRERVLGGVGFTFGEERTFSVDDRHFVLALAQQCAQALERAQLYESEQRARIEAQEAVRIRDAFLSVASHELKNPLTAIIGNAQVLQRRAAREGTLTERNQRGLTIIVEQATRMNEMLATLLDISRIEMGQLQIERNTLDIAALTRRVVADIQPTLKKHTINLDGAAAPLLVAGDPLRLEQVLQNLIQNAIKYSPQGGHVAVQIEQRDTQVCIAITDQGIGIAAEAIPHLFRRFYRAESADTQHIEGTGIGLYVVKEIITLHGGEVVVESTEGKGSTFTIRLSVLQQSRTV